MHNPEKRFHSQNPACLSSCYKTALNKFGAFIDASIDIDIFCNETHSIYLYLLLFIYFTLIMHDVQIIHSHSSG